MKEEIEKVKSSCTRYIYGHYPKTPKEYFKELSEITDDDVRADHYGEGKVMNDFESYLSGLFGHEACLFLPSGTMAQVIALKIFSDESENDLVGFHPLSHLEIHEHKSYEHLYNLKSILIGKKERLISLDDLKAIKISPSSVLMELPQREIGGQLPEWSELIEQIEYLKSKDIKVHLDGARIWECTSYYKKNIKEITQLFDSVYVSFYKGIGGVAGSALIGDVNFIKKAKVWVRRHGGNLYTLFPLYLSAKLELEKRIDKFDSYFTKTKEIVFELSKIKGIEVVPQNPQVNMFHMFIKGNENELRGKALEISKKSKIWIPGGLEQVNENVCKYEWYVGDATLDVETSEIKELFLELTT